MVAKQLGSRGEFEPVKPSPFEDVPPWREIALEKLLEGSILIGRSQSGSGSIQSMLGAAEPEISSLNPVRSSSRPIQRHGGEFGQQRSPVLAHKLAAGSTGTLLCLGGSKRDHVCWAPELFYGLQIWQATPP